MRSELQARTLEKLTLAALLAVRVPHRSSALTAYADLSQPPEYAARSRAAPKTSWRAAAISVVSCGQ